MVRWGYLRSCALVALGAMLWVTGAMIVAFPNSTTALQFQQMYAGFLGDFMHPVSIIFLWVLDVFIVVGCLQDGRIRAAIGKWLTWILGALVLFIIVAIIVPHSNPALSAGHALAIGLFATLFIVIARALSYVAPQQGNPI
ncbi:MAG: hypothetical protein WA268_14225 [Xanthobacteraceae bacterium]